MNKLSTKNIKTESAGESKTLNPGNVKAKINHVELRKFPYEEGALEIILHVEGEDLGADFVGFHIDKDDPTKGNYKGKIGRVNSSQWAYKDGTTKSGIEISRDMNMLKFIKQLCDALGISGWLDAQDNKHETIESLITAFDKEMPYKDIFMEYCIAGKEYLNKGGYSAYNLFLPKFTKDKVPFSKDISKVISFKEEEHIIKKKNDTVTEFGSDMEKTSDFGI